MQSGYLFFVQFTVWAVPGRFASVFYQAHGQSPAQVGFILALASVFVIVGTPIFCNVADNAKSRERVVAVLYGFSIVAFLLQFVAVPSLGLIAPAFRFPVLLVLASVVSFFSMPTVPIVIAICIARLRKLYGPNGHVRFGRERMWGAVSWGGTSLLVGYCLDAFNIGIVYVLYTAFCVLFIITILLFRRLNDDTADIARNLASGEAGESGEVDPLLGVDTDTHEQHGSRDEPAALSFFEVARIIVLDGDIVNFAFFILIFTVSIGMMVVQNLQFLYFVDELSASNLICGIAVIITVLFEMPLFGIAPTLLRHLGPEWLTIYAALAYAFRAIGYSMVPSAWVALFLEPLHGVTFAALQTASVAYVAQRTPPGGDACVQGLPSLLRASAGVVGTSIGGIIMQAASGRVLYFCTGTLVFVVMVVFVVLLLLFGTAEQGNVLRKSAAKNEIVPSIPSTADGNNDEMIKPNAA